MAIATGLIKAESDPAAAAVASSAPPLTKPVTDGKALTAGEIFEKDGPAVAFIEAEQAGATSQTPVGPLPGNGGTATGSGFLIDDQGTILTNAHVVDGSKSVTVKLGEDGDTLDAEVRRRRHLDRRRGAQGRSGEVQAAPVQIGDSDQSAVGDPVVAIGNPFGLDRTITTGYRQRTWARDHLP